jgi:drug/metabolite transporter (DMT)-like permease
MIWGETLTPLAVFGMVLIVAAGAMIALRAKVQEA